MNRWRAAVIVSAALAVGGALVAGAPGQASAQALTQASPLNLAFTAASMRGVPAVEIEATMAVWVKTLAESRGLRLASTTTVHDNPATLLRAIESGAVHLATMTMVEYWQMGMPAVGTVFVGTRKGRVGQEVVLVTRADRAAGGLAGLKGGTLAILETGGDAMARPWLEWLARDQGVRDLSAHFAQIESVHRPARAVLPVFFGQRDACVLTRGAFDTMVELNPQIARTLAVVSSSAPLQHSLIILTRRYDAAIRPTVVDALLHLHQTPRGQQVLGLFGRETLVEAPPGAHDTSMKLLASVYGVKATK